jgi:hypothetical protein
VAWLLPRLSSWRPEGLRIIVALDGHPAPGQANRSRVRQGVQFLHSGSRSADDVLIELLSRQPYAGRARTALVTRDRGLAARARQAGGRTRSVAWLRQHLAAAIRSSEEGPARSGPVGIGRGGPPLVGRAQAPDPGAQAREPWQPGRGATRKRGNPLRGAKPSRRR